MNNLKIYGIIILLFIVNNIFAQTIHTPSNPDEFNPATQEAKVNNTGNDMLNYEVNGNHFIMKITVADGTEPHIIFKSENNYAQGQVFTNIIDNSLCANRDIIDPDVVLVNDFNNQTVDAIIVYETKTGDINIIIKEYDINGVFNNNPNYINGISIGHGTNPNIDVSTVSPTNMQLFVITWEDNGDIKSITGEWDANVGLFNLGATVTIYDKTIHDDFSVSLPDVTINYLGSYGSGNPPQYWNVTYCFVEEKNKLLYTYLDDFMNIYNGVINSNNLSIRHTFNSSDLLGTPRIASPDLGSTTYPYGAEDYTIVMGGIIDPQPNMPVFRILGYNRHYDNQNQIYVNNDHYYEYSQTPNIYEGKPVIAYVGDISIVAWEIDAWQPNGYGLDGLDIIQRQLTYDASPVTNFYSRVNMDVVGNQFAPSVASFSTDRVLYSFYDENSQNIRFKSTGNSQIYLRIRKDDDKLGIYPNPAHNNVTINLKEAANLTIYDMNGRIILEKQLFEGNQKIDISNINSGIYFMKLKSNSELKAEKFIIY